jgi:hypothetical protein
VEKSRGGREGEGKLKIPATAQLQIYADWNPKIFSKPSLLVWT